MTMIKVGLRKPSLKKSIAARTKGRATRALKKQSFLITGNAVWVGHIRSKKCTMPFTAELPLIHENYLLKPTVKKSKQKVRQIGKQTLLSFLTKKIPFKKAALTVIMIIKKKRQKSDILRSKTKKTGKLTGYFII